VYAAPRIDPGTTRIEWRGYTVNFSFPAGGPSGAALRFYEVTYDRLYRAFGNLLDLNSSGAKGMSRSRSTASRRRRHRPSRSTT
jgi:hypothetical protein